jgi:hypothetical protein
MFFKGARVAVSVVAAATGLIFSLSGCGGSSNNNNNSENTVQTGANGRLAAVSIGPAPGSVFIGKASTFQVRWPSSDPPPAEFTPILHRYKEANGGLPREITEQNISITRQGTDYVWNIARRDNFDLDGEGVYYLELRSGGGQQVLSTFITGSNRSASTSAAATRAETENPNTGGNLSGLQILPAAGSTFIAKGTAFQLVWNQGIAPPSQFSVALRRFKEARGDAGKTDEEQRIDVDRVGDTFTWNVKRRDNFNMDVSGVYYVEVTAPGETPFRAAYIISSDN